MPEDVRHRPRLPDEALRESLDKAYGLAITDIRPLPGERDLNVRVIDATGQRYVLKVAHPDAGEDVLAMQNAAMACVCQTDGDQTVAPRVIPDAQGRLVSTWPVAGARPWRLRLLSYVEGTPLAKVQPQSDELLYQLGVFLGNLTRRLKGFDHPAAHRVMDWDLSRAGEVIRRHRNNIPPGRRRECIDDWLRIHDSEVAPGQASLPRSVIHGDANDYNILISRNEAGEARVAGIIDFGDMVYSCTLNELAIGLAYAMLDKAEPLAAAARVVAGYETVARLTTAERSQVLLLACLRLCVSVCMSAHQRALDPDNAYLSITEAPAWRLIEQLNPVPSTQTWLKQCRTNT